MKKIILLALSFVVGMLACNKSKDNCWECKSQTVQYKNGVKIQDVTQSGTQCNLSQEDLEKGERGKDTTYVDLNGDTRRLFIKTTCTKK